MAAAPAVPVASCTPAWFKVRVTQPASRCCEFDGGRGEGEVRARVHARRAAGRQVVVVATDIHRPRPAVTQVSARNRVEVIRREKTLFPGRRIQQCIARLGPARAGC
jgi:hypothetical protein